MALIGWEREPVRLEGMSAASAGWRLTRGDADPIGLGAVLLLFGRRLYWLALGGAGFLLGLWLAAHVLDLQAGWVELGLGLVAGIACACLAFFAQKIAITVAGLALGGAGAFWIASQLVPLTGGPLAPWLFAFFVAILGAILAPALFEASLAVFSALVGAMLIVSASHLGSPRETWLFVILLVVGLIAQTGGKKKRRRRRRSAED